MCGIPGSGKTTRAQEIKKYLEETHKLDVELFNEENLSLDKKNSYSSTYTPLLTKTLDNIKEKECRGFLRSNVDKSLSQNTTVILDSMNYIKGYRYELFCIARTAKTPHCVVYLNTPIDVAEKWNG